MKRHFVKAGAFAIKRWQKPTIGNSIVKEMTGNPNFPSGETATILSELQTASNNLGKANEKAKSGSHEAVAIAKEKEHEWNLKYGAAARYVQKKADADIANSKSIILSSGFGVRKTREKAPVPATVAVIKAIFCQTPGEILVKWKHSKYSIFYSLYISIDGINWQFLDSIGQRKLLVTGLASLTRYYFRVVAGGTAGAAAPSAVVSQITA